MVTEQLHARSSACTFTLAARTSLTLSDTSFPMQPTTAILYVSLMTPTDLIYLVQPYVAPIAMLFLTVAATIAVRRQRSLANACFAIASWLVLSNTAFLMACSYVVSQRYLDDGSVTINYPQPLHTLFAGLAISGGCFAIAGAIALIRRSNDSVTRSDTSEPVATHAVG